MKDWIEKILSFLGDVVIKFVSPVLTFLLGIICERMKSKKKSKNLKQIIFAELTQFLATFISYSLKCYIRGLINSLYGLEIKIIALKRYKSIKDEPFNRSRIKIIEEKIRDLEKEIRQQIAPILNNRRQLIDETFGWIFALNKKYEEIFSEKIKIVKEIKDLQESIEDFYNKLEKFHEGLIDGEFIMHFLNKYRSIEPEVTGIYFDMVLSKSITQNLTYLEDFDNGLVKELSNILSELALLDSKKSKYSYPDFCIQFIKEIKPLILKIDEILEKEGTKPLN
jgi:hypothetical protein